MENDKFIKGTKIEIVKDSGCYQKILKGDIGLVTHVYKSGNIRISSNEGRPWVWEIFMLSKSKENNILFKIITKGLLKAPLFKFWIFYF